MKDIWHKLKQWKIIKDIYSNYGITATAGIGTKGRSWYTGVRKNIAATLILYPTCKVEKLDNLTVEIAEKIANFLPIFKNAKMIKGILMIA